MKFRYQRFALGTYDPGRPLIARPGRVLPLDVGFSRQVGLPILGRSFFRHYRAIIFNELNEEVELRP